MLGDVLLDVEEDNGNIWKVFYCVGCGTYHYLQLNINMKNFWSWDGNSEYPTFTPSILVRNKEKETICHLEINNGMIKYFDDCKHEFAGLTISMSEA